MKVLLLSVFEANDSILLNICFSGTCAGFSADLYVVLSPVLTAQCDRQDGLDSTKGSVGRAQGQLQWDKVVTLLGEKHITTCVGPGCGCPRHLGLSSCVESFLHWKRIRFRTPEEWKDCDMRR